MKKEKAYIIRHPRSKTIIPKCNRRDCDGNYCDDMIFSNRKCAENMAENMLDGVFRHKHYRVYEVEITLTTK
jgi:hypothetical protein